MCRLARGYWYYAIVTIRVIICHPIYESTISVCMCCSCLLLSYQYTHPILSPLSLCLQQLVHLFYFIFCLFSCLLLPFLFFPSSTSFTFCPLLFPVYLCCYSNIFTLVTDYQLIHPISLFKYPQSEKRQQSNISNLQVRKVYKPRSRFFFFFSPLSHTVTLKSLQTHTPFLFLFYPLRREKSHTIQTRATATATATNNKLQLYIATVYQIPSISNRTDCLLDYTSFFFLRFCWLLS